MEKEPVFEARLMGRLNDAVDALEEARQLAFGWGLIHRHGPRPDQLADLLDRIRQLESEVHDLRTRILTRIADPTARPPETLPPPPPPEASPPGDRVPGVGARGLPAAQREYAPAERPGQSGGG